MIKNIPLFDIKAQNESLRSEIDKAIQMVRSSGSFILGETVERFELAVGAHLGGDSIVVGTGCGTDALLLSLMAHGIGSGHEVITTAHSFLATGNAIIRSGASPVFVDVCPRTFNLDPWGIEAAITKRTRAIMPVHLMGRPVESESFLELAEKHDLVVVGDAAQAFGALHKDKPVGTLFPTECFSTFPTKPLGGLGDGGFVVTRSKAVARRIKALRAQGCETKFIGKHVGLNSRLDALQAAVLLQKLPYTDVWRCRRADIALRYREAFEKLPILTQLTHAGHAWHCFPLICDSRPERDMLRLHLKDEGISSAIHYPVAMSEQPSFARFYRNCPKTEQLCSNGLSIPIYAELSDEDVQRIIGAVTSFFEQRKG